MSNEIISLKLNALLEHSDFILNMLGSGTEVDKEQKLVLLKLAEGINKEIKAGNYRLPLLPTDLFAPTSKEKTIGYSTEMFYFSTPVVPLSPSEELTDRVTALKEQAFALQARLDPLDFQKSRQCCVIS